MLKPATPLWLSAAKTAVTPVRYCREGRNMVTKHVKPRRQGEQGGIVKAEGAMYASKVMPVCPKCGKATRVGHTEKDGKKVRVCKKCGAEF